MVSVASSSHHIQSYHKHDHLLFQFILLELILAHQELYRINKIALSLKKKVSKELFDDLASEIVKLSGASRGYMRIFVGSDLGILTKLKNICAFFSQSNSSSDLETEMYEAANQAWLSSLQALDIMTKYSANESDKGKKAPISQLTSCLEKINKNIKKLAECASEVVFKFRNDENVIFFLLVYHHSLDTIYGKEFVLKCLRKMFAKKELSVVEDFLVFKYTERGFKHLIPVIHEKIEAIEKRKYEI